VEGFDFDVEMRRIAVASEEASQLIEVSKRDIAGLDSLNDAGHGALLAWHRVSTLGFRHLCRYLDRMMGL
jgi:hypothetical protein